MYKPDESPAGAGYTFALISSLTAGMATVVGKWNLTETSSLIMSGTMFAFASLVLTWFIFRKRKHTPLFRHSSKGWLWLILFTISSLFAIWTFWTGVQMMDPSLAAFLNRTEVLVAIILGIVFLKERFTKLEVTGGLISIFGIILMKMTLRIEYSTGFWYVLAGSLFFGLTEFFSKQAVKHIEPMVLTYLRNLFMTIIFWIIILSLMPPLEGLKTVWPGVIVLGLLGPLISRLMYLKALRNLELSKVAIISQSQPVFVLIITLFVFQTMPTFREFLGGICLICGCVIMITARKWKKQSTVR